MAGRPTKIHTIEDIEAKLEPWALGFLYAPEQEARQRYLFSEREKILTSEGQLYDTVFSDIDQQSYMDIIINIIVHGPQSTHFNTLPELLREKIIALEGQPTPRLLRKPLQFLQEQLDKGEDTAKDKLQEIYSATKFINLYYKWVLTPPSNGRPNFYSCFMKKEYPKTLREVFTARLVTRCDYTIDTGSLDKLKKQEQIFDFIKENALKDTKETKLVPIYFELTKIPKQQQLDIIDEIAQALEAVTLEDVTARPSTRKEKGAQPANGPIIFQEGGYYGFLAEFDKHTENNSKKNPLAQAKKYVTPFSTISLEAQLLKSCVEKSSSTSKILRTLAYLAKQEESNVRKSYELIISKEDYMRYMMLSEEQIKDPIYRQNFFARQLKQYAFLRSMTWTIEEGQGKGRVGGIIDYAEINNTSIIVKFSQNYIDTLFSLKFYPYQPCTLEANKVPDRLPRPYYLQIKLENLFMNVKRQANDKEEYLQLTKIIAYLEKLNLIDPQETKYKERLCNRIIESLDYLQNENKSIEYYLCATPDGPALEEEELEKYKNRNVFPKLYLWFRVPALEEYLDHDNAKSLQRKFAEIRAKRQARREQARDRKLGELEAERIDKAREKAEAEAKAKAQNEQPKPKTLDEYYKQGNQ